MWAGTTGIVNHSLRVRVIMANQVAMGILVAVGVPTLLFQLFGADYALAGMALPLLMMPLVVVFNFFRLRNLSRITLITGTVLCVYLGTSLLGQASYVYLFLYPTALLAVVLFHRRETLRMWYGILLVILANTLMGFEVLWPFPAAETPQWLFDGTRALSLAGSLSLLTYTFWQNHVQLVGLVIRNLEKERARNEDLQRKDDELKEYAHTLEVQNVALENAQVELRRSKNLLEYQTGELAARQEQLNQVISDMQAKQERLERAAYFDQGTARMAEAIRWEGNMDVAVWSERVLRELVLYAGGVLGALHTLDADGETLWLASSFGLSEESLVNRRQSVEASLAGQAALTKKLIRLTGLESLSGRAKPLMTAAGALQPTDLVIVPLMYQGQLKGVVEVLAVSPMTERAIEFLERQATVLAASLLTLQSQQHVLDLLKQKDAFADQLIEREQLLHKNIEKLVSASHDMKFSDRKLRQSQAEQERKNIVLTEQAQQMEIELNSLRQQLQAADRDLQRAERLTLTGSTLGMLTDELLGGLSVMSAASDNLLVLLPRLAAGLAQLSASVDQEQRTSFYTLAAQVLTTEVERPAGSERGRRRQITQQLSVMGLTQVDDMARMLVESGLDLAILSQRELLLSASGPMAVAMLSVVAQLRQNIAAIQKAVAREHSSLLAVTYVNESSDSGEGTQPAEALQHVLRGLSTALHGTQHEVRVAADLPLVAGSSLHVVKSMLVALALGLELTPKRKPVTISLSEEGLVVQLKLIEPESKLTQEQFDLAVNSAVGPTAKRSILGLIRPLHSLQRARAELGLINSPDGGGICLSLPVASHSATLNAQASPTQRATQVPTQSAEVLTA
jgi:hypothetical protein